MGAREVGDLCEAVRRARGWSLARVAWEIGLVPPNEKALNESQAKRILEGRRGLDRWMVNRLITVFNLDPAEAWAAAGLLPPGVTAADLRKLTGAKQLTGWSVPALPIPADLDDLIRPLRPPMAVVLPLHERRRGRGRRRTDRQPLEVAA